jgi:hypothetical protein
VVVSSSSWCILLTTRISTTNHGAAFLVRTVASDDEELHTKIQAIQAASSTSPRARKLNRSWLAEERGWRRAGSWRGQGRPVLAMES